MQCKFLTIEFILTYKCMRVYNNHFCISDYLEFNAEFIELIKGVQLSTF